MVPFCPRVRVYTPALLEAQQGTSYSVKLVFHRIEFCNLVSVVFCNPHTALIIDGDPVGQRYGKAICIVRLGSPKSV